MQAITDPMENAVRRADRLMYQAKCRKNAVTVEVPGCSLAAPEKLLQEKSQILLVDDSKMNRMILAEILGDGYHILEAENGQKCLEDVYKRQAEADGAALQCTVVRGGTLQSRKSLAAPGLTVASPTLTEELSLIHILKALALAPVLANFAKASPSSSSNILCSRKCATPAGRCTSCLLYTSLRSRPQRPAFRCRRCRPAPRGTAYRR